MMAEHYRNLSFIMATGLNNRGDNMNYDNSVPKKVYAYKPLNPWGYNVLILNDSEEVPSDCTTIVPPNIDRPKFNFDTQQWESAPETPATPTDQDKINAQIMLDQAKQKKEQDAFNAQVLLQLAKIGGNK